MAVRSISSDIARPRSGASDITPFVQLASELRLILQSTLALSGTAKTLFDQQVPITCGGVEVRPDDILFGDGDGIVVLSEDEFEDTISTAEDVERKEAAAFDAMAAGRSLMEMVNLEEHIAAVRAGEQSRRRIDA